MSKAYSFLFVTFEGGGNVSPVLGLARGLGARGHRVRVLTEPCLAGAVARAGAQFVPFETHFTRRRRDEVLLRDWQARTPVGALRRTLADVVAGPAAIVARHTLAALDAAPADVVAADWLMPGALLAAEARGVPSAALLHCVDMRPGPGKPGPGLLPARSAAGRLRDHLARHLLHHIADAALPGFNDARRGLGLAPLAHLFDAYDRADRVLVQTSAAFDFPATPAPPNVRYVGPVLEEPDWVEDTPWTPPWPAEDQRPLVVVSLSSTFQNQAALLRQALSALGRLPVRGFVTLGPALGAEAFAVPDNVVVAAQAPHGRVFPHADAFVTHGGHGSVMRALAHGVPLVVVPMGRDQDDTAARVVARGLGLRARRTPAALARAIRRVLGEPAFRTAARHLGALIRQEAAAARGLAELEALARQARPAMPAGAPTS